MFWKVVMWLPIAVILGLSVLAVPAILYQAVATSPNPWSAFFGIIFTAWLVISCFILFVHRVQDDD